MANFRFKRRRPRKWLFWLAAVLLLSAALVAGRTIERSAGAVSLLADIISPPAGEADGVTSTRRTITYTVDGRERRGDLYRPVDRARAMVVLVPGASRTGKDDARFVAFARSLTRARFRVLVPDIAGLRQLQVSSTDALEIADAVHHLGGDAGPNTDGSVGIVAISYAAGPAILAALSESVRSKVRFVYAIGGYYDLVSVLTYSITGHYRVAGAGRKTHPNQSAKWLYVRGNAGRVSDPDDRAALFDMATRKLEDPKAPIDDIVARLGSEGRAVHALMVNRKPEKVLDLIAGLPGKVRGELQALNLAGRDLSKLNARLILVHGRDDPIIPAGESEALARAVPAGRVELFVVDRLAHVELKPGSIVDSVALFRAAYSLLRERDTMVSPLPYDSASMRRLQPAAR